VGYNFIADVIGLHSFSRCCPPPRNCEIPTKMWPYSSSGLFKVIDLGVNRKPIFDFLLVINSNFGRICYRFRDIAAQV